MQVASEEAEWDGQATQLQRPMAGYQRFPRCELQMNNGDWCIWALASVSKGAYHQLRDMETEQSAGVEQKNEALAIGNAFVTGDPLAGDDGASDADGLGIREEIAQRRPFHSVKAEVAVSILRTAAIIERHFAQVVASTGVTIQQYNVLRILRGAGVEGMPTLVIRDRMIHAAPGITRLLDKLETAGLARRERTSPDRRQVFCYITDAGRAVLDQLEVAMKEADDVAVGNLTEAEQRQLIHLLEGVRARHRVGSKV
jgi:MarR family transcriptional regulator, organic hydroperoxide resistance regulator